LCGIEAEEVVFEVFDDLPLLAQRRDGNRKFDKPTVCEIESTVRDTRLHPVDSTLSVRTPQPKLEKLWKHPIVRAHSVHLPRHHESRRRLPDQRGDAAAGAWTSAGHEEVTGLHLNLLTWSQVLGEFLVVLRLEASVLDRGGL
jgi:hypothetical protein